MEQHSLGLSVSTGKYVITQGCCGALLKAAQAVQGVMVADPSKACTELGWQRTASLRQLVDEMVDNDMKLATTAV